MPSEPAACPNAYRPLLSSSPRSKQRLRGAAAIGPARGRNRQRHGFFRGRFDGWNVAVVEAGPGNAGAAAIAVRAIQHYNPDIALFVGVAGGIKDVVIGDVVVATKAYGYESGKDTAKGFQTRPDVQNTAHELEQRARVIRQQDGWKKRLDPSIQHDSASIFVAPIAAGEKVVASKKAATATLIKEHYGDAVAVEMEGSGS
jgi:nucleoside phosphorylase